MRELTKLTVFASGAMFVLASIMTGLSATLVPLAGEFGVAATRAGVFYSIHFGGFMTFVVLSIAIHGLRARLIATVAAAAIYAVSLTVSGLTALFPLMAVSLFVAGGCGGILEAHTSTIQVMTARDEGQAGRVLAVTQATFAVGALFAPVYLSLELAGGWRGLFVILAAVSGVTVYFGARVRSAGFRHVQAEKGKLRWRNLSRVSLALACYVGAEVTLFGWIPTVMEYYRGIPVSRARLSASVFWVGMLVGRLVVARLTHRFRPRNLLGASAAVSVVTATAIPFISEELWLWAAVVVAAFAAAGIWPLIVATSGSSGHETGTTIAIAAGGLGATVFPYLAGLTAEVLPGNFIPILAAPLFVIVLIQTLGLPVERRQDV